MCKNVGSFGASARNGRLLCLLVLVLAIGPAARVFGDFSILEDPAYSSDVYDHFSGEANFQSSSTIPPVFFLNADVDYAVFAPGKFPAALGIGQTSDYTPPANDYIYAYQIADLDVPSPASDVYVLSILFTGSMGGGSISHVGQTDPVGSSSDVPYTDVFLNISSYYDFTSIVLPPGENSFLLFYASPLQPVMSISEIIGGNGLSDGDVPLPSPTNMVMNFGLGNGVPAPKPLAGGAICIGLLILQRMLAGRSSESRRRGD
jgi:hypothetical protein